MALATAEAIRDRCYTLLEAIAPATDSLVKLRRYRNEGAGDFIVWAESNARPSFRRFQIREVGDDIGPLTTNTTEERITVEFEIAIAYPQDHRYGAQNAMDRDDVINQDWLDINWAVGIYGRANFSSTNDCTPLGAVKRRERGNGVDFMMVRARFEYLRSTT